jgi:hypothetical protein
MARVPLTGGAYSARSVIANAQRCVNLYPEMNPSANEPPVPVTHYLTPGLTLMDTPSVGAVRGLYRATNGGLYAVVGANVYFIDPGFNATLMGNIAAGTTPVSMSDNGIVGVLVDGTASGYTWAIGSLILTAIADPSFYGANRVCFLDGFFIFNRPGTNQFYLSPPFWDGVSAFNGTYIASKTGGPDQIISIAVVHGNLWLIGQLTTEVWFNAGAADFPFQRQPGVFIEHGMLRGWTVAETDVEVIWLGRDRQGQCVVFMGRDYQAVRISNHALEASLQSYVVVNDAIGFAYQQDGHTFYVLIFPTADRTWVYDLSTEQWHERTWTDPATGLEHRHRANCFAFAYNITIVGDWQNGRIYWWNLDQYTDAGDPIVRRRGFPHMVKDGKRISYSQFILDMEVGTPLTVAPPGPDVMVRWSDTRGASWGDTVPINMGFGGSGEYYRSLSIRRLGMARDRVFEVYWSFPYKTALNGAWVEIEKAET